MKVLITGAGGFVGKHLAAELTSVGIELILTSDKEGFFNHSTGKTTTVLKCDISDRTNVDQIFKEYRPDAIVHLAAISHVVNAQDSREKLSEINIIGTHNVCSAAAALEKDIKFLFVSTSLVYGAGSANPSTTDDNLFYNELSLPCPDSAYGASKIAGEFLVRSFATDKFKPYIIRPFNHIGPGQHINFVCPSLASKVAMTPDGGTIKVGNLKTFRDFTDVRDVVRAYRLILKSDLKEDLFVIGSGSVIRIDEILRKIIEISGKNINTEIDTSLLRDIDPPRLCADPARAQKILGWKPEYFIEDTLKDIYAEAVLNNAHSS